MIELLVCSMRVTSKGFVKDSTPIIKTGNSLFCKNNCQIKSRLFQLMGYKPLSGGFLFLAMHHDLLLTCDISSVEIGEIFVFSNALASQ